MKHANSRKFFATLALLLLSSCGQKEKGSSSDAVQCPDGATLIGDACATGVQPGIQPDNGSNGDSPGTIPIDPIPPDPTPTPIPTPSPTPEPTDGNGSDESNGDDGDDSSSDDSVGHDTGDDSGAEDGTDGGDGTVPLEPLHYIVTSPVYSASTYAEIELEARTLRIEHDADMISCSNDGGTTFSACAGADRHVFSIDAYKSNTLQVIRFTRTNGINTQYEDYTYRPQAEGQALVTFVVCDNVITANDSLDVLTKLFSSAIDRNKDGVTAVCFEQGLTVTTNSHLTIAVDRLLLIGHSTNRTLISNANTGSSVAPCGDNRNRLLISNGKSFALTNLNLQTRGCRGSVLEIIGTQSMDFVIENSLLSAFGEEADAVSVLSTKGNTTGRVTQSVLSALGNEQRNFYPNGLAVNQVSGSIAIDLTTSEIRSTFDNPIHLVGGTLRISNALISSAASGSVAMHAESSAGRNANILIQDSILKAESFGIVQKTSSTIGQVNIIEVNPEKKTIHRWYANDKLFCEQIACSGCIARDCNYCTS